MHCSTREGCPSRHTERPYGPIGRAKISDEAMVDGLTKALGLIHGLRN
jgi:hypothetical protein